MFTGTLESKTQPPPFPQNIIWLPPLFTQLHVSSLSAECSYPDNTQRFVVVSPAVSGGKFTTLGKSPVQLRTTDGQPHANLPARIHVEQAVGSWNDNHLAAGLETHLDVKEKTRCDSTFLCCYCAGSALQRGFQTTGQEQRWRRGEKRQTRVGDL